MINGAFIPNGPTSLCKATTTASEAIQPSTGSIQGFTAFCASTAITLLAVGVSTATAALPTTSAAAQGIPLPPNIPMEFRAAPNFWVSVITSTAGGTADVYITPGIGI